MKDKNATHGVEPMQSVQREVQQDQSGCVEFSGVKREVGPDECKYELACENSKIIAELPKSVLDVKHFETQRSSNVLVSSQHTEKYILQRLGKCWFP